MVRVAGTFDPAISDSGDVITGLQGRGTVIIHNLSPWDLRFSDDYGNSRLAFAYTAAPFEICNTTPVLHWTRMQSVMSINVPTSICYLEAYEPAEKIIGTYPTGYTRAAAVGALPPVVPEGGSMPVNGEVNITNATVPISGPVDANITNANVPISGNVAITSGTIDATIQNANIKTDVINNLLPVTNPDTSPLTMGARFVASPVPVPSLNYAAGETKVFENLTPPTGANGLVVVNYNRARMIDIQLEINAGALITESAQKIVNTRVYQSGPHFTQIWPGRSHSVSVTNNDTLTRTYAGFWVLGAATVIPADMYTPKSILPAVTSIVRRRHSAAYPAHNRTLRWSYQVPANTQAIVDSVSGFLSSPSTSGSTVASVEIQIRASDGITQLGTLLLMYNRQSEVVWDIRALGTYIQAGEWIHAYTHSDSPSTLSFAVETQIREIRA